MPGTLSRTAVVVWLVAASLAARPVQAQRGTAGLVGWVKDSSGTPVTHADIIVQGVSAQARTDSAGRFRLSSLDPGAITVLIRRVGFDPETFDITLRASVVDSVNIEMHQNVMQLDAVKTSAADVRYRALQDFYDHRAQGHGTFFTREDLVKFNTLLTSDAIRQTPGVRLVRVGPGKFGIRFESNGNHKRDCPPAFWLDNRRVSGAEIDDFPVPDIQAIELYSGFSITPVRFTEPNSPNCGTVVIWSRIPNTP